MFQNRNKYRAELFTYNTEYFVNRETNAFAESFNAKIPVPISFRQIC